jgi:antitoxin component of MazEF toxin-antitoxin module
MGTTETRKLLKVGHSIVVCLPPGWLAWNELKPGDIVRLVTNGKLTITKIKSKESSKNEQNTTAVH